MEIGQDHFEILWKVSPVKIVGIRNYWGGGGGGKR